MSANTMTPTLLRVFQWRPLRYLLSGGTAAVVNLTLLFLLVHYLHVWYLPAAALAYAAAIGVSFLMQKFFTFNDYRRAQFMRQSVIYAAFQAANIGVNTFLIYGLVEYAHAQYLVAQVVSGAAIALYTFVVMNQFIFRPDSPHTELV